MPQNIRCPSCREPLVVHDDAPATITCPRCLATFTTRQDILPQSQPAPASATMADIPYAREVADDLAGANRTIVLVAVLMIGAGIFIFFRTWSALGPILIVCGAILAGVWSSVLRARRAGRQLQPDAPLELAARPGDVLSYAPPGKSGGSVAGATIGRFVGGFFLGIGVCAACFFLFGGTFEEPAPFKTFIFGAAALVIVGSAILATYLERRTMLFGLGRGVAVGLILGLMALGPCAFCYII